MTSPHKIARGMNALVLASLLVLSILGLFGCRPAPPVPRQPSMLGPDLSNQLKASILPSLDQPPKSLAEYSGKNGMLLLFVNASCPFSQGAAKDLPAMADIFAKQGLMIAIVNIDDAEARVREHYAGKQPVPVLFDVTTATHERWAIDSVPTAIVVSSSQKQVYRGTAVWAGVAAAAESGLSLSTGSLRVQPKGSGYG